MAIEFDCPYCSTTVRVADQFAGRKSRCPKCGNSLIIPTPAAAPPVPPIEAPTATLAGSTAHTVGAESAATSPASPIPAEAAPPSPAAEEIGIPSFAPPDRGASVARALKRKQRRGKARRIWLFVVPAVCFLALIAVIALTVTSSLPELGGQLTAVGTQSRQAVVKVIEWSELRLPPDDQSTLHEALRRDPEAFISSRLNCTIRADDDGLIIELSPPSGYAWFDVNPLSHRPLDLWEKKERADLNRLRLAEQKRAVSDYVAEKIQILNGDRAVIDAARFRNELALNTHCNALGFALEVMDGSHISRIAHQTEQGHLLVPLPANTTRFTLRGRTVDAGQLLFPGTYEVTVSAASADSKDAAAPTTNGADESIEESADDSPDSNTMDNDSMDEGGNSNADDADGEVGASGDTMQR